VNALSVAQQVIEGSNNPEVALEYVNELAAVARMIHENNVDLTEDEVIQRVLEIAEKMVA
jgi:hypothetical protein